MYMYLIGWSGLHVHICAVYTCTVHAYACAKLFNFSYVFVNVHLQHIYIYLICNVPCSVCVSSPCVLQATIHLLVDIDPDRHIHHDCVSARVCCSWVCAVHRDRTGELGSKVKGGRYKELLTARMKISKLTLFSHA